MAKKDTEIVKQPDNVLPAIPSYSDPMAGFEFQGKSDVKIPFVVQLQALSPICVEGRAKPGQWMNVATGEIFDSFLFVGGVSWTKFAKWKPDRGGFAGHLEPDDPRVKRALAESKKFGSYHMEEEFDDGKGKLVSVTLSLQETKYIYGALCNEQGQAVSPATVAFWSTKIRPFQDLMFQLRLPLPGTNKHVPMAANLLRIGSVADKNAKGSFFIPKIGWGDERGRLYSLLAEDDPRFQLAAMTAKLITSGELDVNYDKSREQDVGDDVVDSVPAGAKPASRAF